MRRTPEAPALSWQGEALAYGALHWALYYPTLWEATLTLNAYCSGELVGTIVLKPSFNIRAGGYGGGGGYGYGY